MSTLTVSSIQEADRSTFHRRGPEELVRARGLDGGVTIDGDVVEVEFLRPAGSCWIGQTVEVIVKEAPREP